MAEYTQTKHVIRYWRGSRSSYNFLKDNNALDPWMRYSVVDVIDGENHIEEYFGSHKITNDFGENLPVDGIVSELPTSGVEPYMRYLVGEDGTGYKIAQYEPKKTHHLWMPLILNGIMLILIGEEVSELNQT